jgi:Lon protease-like protein
MRMLVGRILEGPAIDEHGHPPVVSVMGVGRVVQHRALDDGRFLLLLAGEGRARILELPFEPPYRRASVERLSPMKKRVSDAACAGLVSAATRVISLLRERAPNMRTDLPKGLDAGTLADWCAAQLLVDAAARQEVFETLDEAERVERCTDLLATELLNARRSSPPEPLA